MSSRASLTTSGMIAVSKDLLNNPVRRAILERNALTAALIVLIQAAKTNLVKLSRDEGELRQRLQEIIAELARRDQIHDRVARGMYRGLESAADCAASPELAAPFIAARDSLLPEGLSINMMSYLDQSGNAVRVAERATPAIRDVLSQIQMGAQNLEQVLDSWLENAAVMGELVSERSTLRGDTDETRVSANDLRMARIRWIQVINTLLSTLNLIDIPADDRRRLLSNLQAAEARAAKTRPGEQRTTESTTDPAIPNATDDAPNHDPLPIADEPDLESLLAVEEERV
ncbi:MAG: hypothetical protein H0U74_05570 [Bradymonadaceae bacterium]|nr:hypothetical protein [Lujinxingiaceae bacterium]